MRRSMLNLKKVKAALQLGTAILCASVYIADSALVTADQSIESASLDVKADAVTDNVLELSISGEMITPSAEGPRRFSLASKGRFEFQNHSIPTDLGGPYTLRAKRSFQKAATETTVGKDHKTSVSLSRAYQTIHVFGSDTGLQIVSPKYAMPRKQLDLLQLPFDLLPAAALIPEGEIRVGQKWNTDAWVVPMLTGIEAVVAQSTTCSLSSVTTKSAVIEINGEIEGAIRGSVSKISFTGEMTIDRATGVISSLRITQQEKRTAGPVSPGLDVTAEIKWTQTAVEAAEADAPIIATAPTQKQLQLYLETPLKLLIRHSREWHLFHETSAVLMMRQLRDGTFIAQCNISGTITVPPKEHTPDKEFLTDVQTAVRERKGKVVQEETVRDDAQWRIRHIQAVGQAQEKTIVWDYYLCSAATGEQFSLVFSHSQDDEAAFGDSAKFILAGLQLSRRRPALPFRRQ